MQQRESHPPAEGADKALGPLDAGKIVSALRARPWLGWVLYGLLGLTITYGCWAYYAWYWGTFAEFNRSIEFCEIAYCDFVVFYYEQAKVILTSHAPIERYFYSPTFALLLVPFAHLSQSEAIAAWMWVQTASLVLFVLAGVGLLRKLPWWTHAVFLLLTLTCYPILHNWKWGQANTLFIALAMTTLSLQERVPAGLRALPLALATSARYYPAMYALAFFERRQWRVVPWFVVLALALLFLVPVVLMGPEATWDFYRESAKASSWAANNWVPTAEGSQYMPTVLARLGAAWHWGAPMARTALVGLGYVLTLLNFAAALRWVNSSHELRYVWAFCLIGGSTSLLLPTSWAHYFVYLPMAQAFLLWCIVCSPLALATRLALLLLAWLPSVGLASIFLFNQFATANAYVAGGYLFFSNALMLSLAHGLGLKAFSAPRGAA